MLKNKAYRNKLKAAFEVGMMQGKVSNPVSKKTDSEIWEAFRNGNEDALIFIYDLYVSQLFRFGIQFAPREMVKDAIQDLFLSLMRRRSKGLVKRIAPYLYKALYRIIKVKLDYARKVLNKADMQEIKDWEIKLSNETIVIGQERSQNQSKQLRQFLKELSTKQRQAILLYYYEGLTHNEITYVMGLKNKNSVRKLIYRALSALRNNFKT